MKSERENFSSGNLVEREYNIAGHVFRAYYDAYGKLVFVLDMTQDALLPNVLLVINPVGDRKWDDVLANDYAVDLDTIRPRRDNKFQKLDIEYAGLVEYDALISAYEDGGDIDAARRALDAFRVNAARHAAATRMTTATAIADKSRDTIERANDTIDELNARVRQLRNKLAAQRKEIGREPTKQSAAKILRTEAQIDATNDKIRRAKKRLDNAKKRMADADNDADVAREILENLGNVDVPVPATKYAVASPIATDVAGVVVPPVPMEIDDADDNLPDVIREHTTDLMTTNNFEQGAEDMADEDVKPLFDRDPEILDEEIAFKPIDFGTVPDVAPTPRSDDAPMATATPNFAAINDDVDMPLSFTPPTSVAARADDAPIAVTPIAEDIVVDMPAPVLDSMMPISDTQLSNTPGLADTIDTPMAPISPIPPMDVTPATRPAPVMPDLNETVPPAVNNEPAPMPNVAPAPIASEFRPVSPATGVAPRAMSVNAAGDAATPQKPTILYYVLLMILIVMSIFTLWLYQKKTSDVVPDLTAPVAESVAPVLEPVAPTPVAPVVEDSPIIPNIAEPMPVVEPEIPAVVETVTVESEPEPAPVVEPEPVVEPVIEPVVEPEPAPVVEDVVVKPVVPAPVAETPKPTPVVDKPAYNVSQQENMFVASADYDTGVADYAADVYYDAPVVSYAEPMVTTSVATCDDGSLPDYDGCCTGEIFTDMEDGTFACCTPDGMQCFPPLI